MAEVGGHDSAQALQEARLHMTSAHGGQDQDRTILTLFTLGGRRSLKRERSLKANGHWIGPKCQASSPHCCALGQSKGICVTVGQCAEVRELEPVNTRVGASFS